MSIIKGIPLYDIVEKETSTEEVVSARTTASYLRKRIAESLDFMTPQETEGIGNVKAFRVASLPGGVAAVTNVVYNQRTLEVKEIVVAFAREVVAKAPISLFAGILVHELTHVRQALTGEMFALQPTEVEDVAYSNEALFLVRLARSGLVNPEDVAMRLNVIDAVVAGLREGVMPNGEVLEVEKTAVDPDAVEKTVEPSYEVISEDSSYFSGVFSGLFD